MCKMPGIRSATVTEMGGRAMRRPMYCRLLLARIKQEGHWPIVDKTHLHVSPEPAGFGLNAQAFQNRHKRVEFLPSRFRACRGAKRRPAALGGFGGHREVAYQQDAAADLGYVSIKIPLPCRENPQAGELPRHPRHV